MITSTSNPRVKQVIQWQTKSKERRRDQVFVAEGLKMYLEAPKQLIKEVYLSESFRKQLEEPPKPSDKMPDKRSDKLSNKLSDKLSDKLLDKLFDNLSYSGCETVSDEVFARMSDTQTPQGILAVLAQPEYKLNQLLKQENPLFVVLENLQDPGNLGTILRTGEGAGITGVIIGEGSVDIFNPKVIRSTMGSIYRVPFLYEADLLQTLEQLHAAGVKTYAAHLRGETYYDSFCFRGPTAFLIGNEGNGLTQTLSDAASSYLKIPMEGELESLNASVAAALLMYEAHRQRAGLKILG